MRQLRPVLLAGVFSTITASAGAEPIGAGWAQPGGPGSGVELTYSYSNLLDGGLNAALTREELRHLTGEALAIWAAYVPIHFYEVPDQGPSPSESEYPSVSSDIRIGYQGQLADGSVAHVHLPYEQGGYLSGGLAGDVHLSNDTSGFGKSRWGYGAGDPLALDFFSVMLHEIGHSLGLTHLGEEGAVLGTQLVLFAGGANLGAADIEAIRALYGPGVGSVHPIGEAPLPTPEPGTWVLISSGIALLVRHAVRGARATH